MTTNNSNHNKIHINLPDLNNYRQNFASLGLTLPLKNVTFEKEGILESLPYPSKGKLGWPWNVQTSPKKDIELCDLQHFDFKPAIKEGGRVKPRSEFAVSYPKISIVIPSYNQVDYIEEAIRSVLLQNYPNLELIICDGGSEDGTKEILEKYSPWLSFWQSEKDNGQGHAINLGFSIASGDYFGWINSDDFYLPNCLYKVAQHFLRSNKDFIYGDSLILNESDKSVKYDQSFLVLDRYLRFGGILPSHSSFWKSSIHQPIWEELNCAIDAELWLRLVSKKSRFHLRYPLAVARIQPEAKSVNERYQKLWNEDYEERIWKAYDPIKFWRLRCYEFRCIQSLYRDSKVPTSSDLVKYLIGRNDLDII